MIYSEFKEFLETNATGYSTFIDKATIYQTEKNKARQPKKRWTEKKIDRAVNEMWKQVTQNAYEQVKSSRKAVKAGMQSWKSFMNEIGFLESFNDGIAELELE
ncbi:hypothetical protein [Enterococcus sp. CSURQ0835]|uniref:hypothetical protein n=1 Tax=Enterococcus sp. CSURQ0835 TaxID=2681394 RepID=UPI001358FCC6|nr:hypothetical protein [Enterococcus sp. CSURQ0835]